MGRRWTEIVETRKEKGMIERLHEALREHRDQLPPSGWSKFPTQKAGHDHWA